MLAGGGYATDVMFMVIAWACDDIIITHPSTSLCLYVDDLALHAASTERAVLQDLYQATEHAVALLEDCLGLQVSRGGHVDGRRQIGGKTLAVASSSRLRKSLGKKLKRLGIGTAAAARHLGVDYAPAKRTKRAVQNQRWVKARKRLPRIRSLGLKAGRHVFKTGLIASLTHGAAVYGVRSHHIRDAQQMAAAVSGIGKGHSVSVRLLATQSDPSHLLALPPFLEWAIAAWEGDTDDVVFTAAPENAAKVVTQAADPAAAVTGPASAFLAALFRIGWRSPSPRHVMLQDGSIIDLTVECPRTINKLAMGAMQWTQMASSTVAADLLACRMRPEVIDGKSSTVADWRPELAADWPAATIRDQHGRDKRKQANANKEALNSVPWVDPAAAVIAATRSASVGPKAQAQIASLVDGGWWSPAAKREAGWGNDGSCAACGEARCDHRHYTLECAALNQMKEDFGDVSLFDHARQHPEDPLYVRGVPAQPSRARPPEEVTRMKWLNEAARTTTPLFTGNVFLDGSCDAVGIRWAWRSGWSIVAADCEGRPLFVVYGASPDLLTSSLRAELRALLNALPMAMPPLVLWSDCSTVVRGVSRGSRWCTSGRREGADIWRAIWKRIDDIGPGLVVVKVKGHATRTHIDQGITTAELKRGNDEADKWAKEGTLLAHASSPVKQVMDDYKRAVQYYKWIAHVVNHHEDREMLYGIGNKARNDQGNAVGDRRGTGRRARTIRLHAALPHKLWSLHGNWRCSACGRTAQTNRAKNALARTACRGSAAARLLEWAMGGHRAADRAHGVRRQSLVQQGAVPVNLIPASRKRQVNGAGAGAIVTDLTPEEAALMTSGASGDVLEPQPHIDGESEPQLDVGNDVGVDAMLEDTAADDEDPFGYADLDMGNLPRLARPQSEVVANATQLDQGPSKRRRIADTVEDHHAHGTDELVGNVDLFNQCVTLDHRDDERTGEGFPPPSSVAVDIGSDAKRRRLSRKTPHFQTVYGPTEVTGGQTAGKCMEVDIRAGTDVQPVHGGRERSQDDGTDAGSRGVLHISVGSRELDGRRLGHRLTLTADILWCRICGRYAQSTTRALAKVCAGRAVGPNWYRRRNLLEGRHPVTGRDLA